MMRNDTSHGAWSSHKTLETTYRLRWGILQTKLSASKNQTRQEYGKNYNAENLTHSFQNADTTNFKEQDLLWKADSFSADQKISGPCSQKLIMSQLNSLYHCLSSTEAFHSIFWHACIYGDTVSPISNPQAWDHHFLSMCSFNIFEDTVSVVLQTVPLHQQPVARQKARLTVGLSTVFYDLRLHNQVLLKYLVFLLLLLLATPKIKKKVQLSLYISTTPCTCVEEVEVKLHVLTA